MNIDILSAKQKEVYNLLKDRFESENQFQLWLSMPNKLFRNKTPIDTLLSNSFEYFDRYFGDLKNEYYHKTEV